jgi:hypothetical protein
VGHSSWPDDVAALTTAGAFLVAAITYVQAQRQRRRDQASRLRVWVDAMFVSDPPRQTLTVTNLSDGPVFDVWVQLADGHTLATTDLVPEVPWRTDIAWDGGPRGSRRTWLTDAQGVRWIKETNGAIHRAYAPSHYKARWHRWRNQTPIHPASIPPSPWRRIVARYRPFDRPWSPRSNPSAAPMLPGFETLPPPPSGGNDAAEQDWHA